jgi:ATP:ADP antiporter, AAA family
MLLEKLNSIWGVKKEYRLKVFFITATFFFMTACQALWRPLKVSIFAKMIGTSYVPWAKIAIPFVMIFLIMLYSKLVDVLRRHQLLYCFTIFHGVGGIILYYFLAHPVYGVANTDASPWRLTGWCFYFFMECFGAFMSAVFWSFADSVNNPNDSKRYFGLFVSGSKIGGMCAAGVLYLLTTQAIAEDAVLLPASVLVGSLFLFAAAGAIYLLMERVPGYYMHGYEAAYKHEKTKKQIEEEEEEEEKIEKEDCRSLFTRTIDSLKKMFEGVFVMIRSPYVLGIFSIIAFYEIIIVIFDFIVLSAADSATTSAGGLTAYYAMYMFCMHGVGLLIAFLGTVPLQRFLGIRLSVLVPPVLAGGLLMLALFFQTPAVFFAVIVILRAVNYGLNHPTREALYVPTTKVIKFKAKAWTDAFGSRISKGAGSFFNVFVNGLALPSIIFSMGLAAVWFVVSKALGNRYQHAIDNKEVIGEELETK